MNKICGPKKGGNELTQGNKGKFDICGESFFGKGGKSETGGKCIIASRDGRPCIESLIFEYLSSMLDSLTPTNLCYCDLRQQQNFCELTPDDLCNLSRKGACKP